jgi:hypothetical protein
MGMIFLNDEDINIKGIITRWIKERNNNVVEKGI